VALELTQYALTLWKEVVVALFLRKDRPGSTFLAHSSAFFFSF
jgi:hypothetical protein